MGSHKKMILENLKEMVGDGWVWCLHCERVYKPEDVRYDHEADLFMCFYPECNGDAFLDAWPYEGNVREGHPDYPVIPEKGVFYPLY